MNEEEAKLLQRVLAAFVDGERKKLQAKRADGGTAYAPHPDIWRDIHIAERLWIVYNGGKYETEGYLAHPTWQARRHTRPLLAQLALVA